MKRKTLPIGILVLALMVAFGGLGVVYGAYTQNMGATFTVNTATFNVHFANESVSGESANGQTTCTLSGQGSSALGVAIAKALPGEGCILQASIMNESSIPVTISGGSPSTLPSWLMYYTDWDPNLPQPIAASGSLVLPAINVWVAPGNTSVANNGSVTFTFQASN